MFTNFFQSNGFYWYQNIFRLFVDLFCITSLVQLHLWTWTQSEGSKRQNPKQCVSWHPMKQFWIIIAEKSYIIYLCYLMFISLLSPLWSNRNRHFWLQSVLVSVGITVSLVKYSLYTYEDLSFMPTKKDVKIILHKKVRKGKKGIILRKFRTLNLPFK